jgi:hypothetical protein
MANKFRKAFHLRELIETEQSIVRKALLKATSKESVRLILRHDSLQERKERLTNYIHLKT